MGGGFFLRGFFFELSFFKAFFLNPLSFWGGLMKNLFSFKPFSFELSFFKGISFLNFLFFGGGFDEKSFLAFLVSEKLDANLSDSF
ncbi:hypothetical protein DDP37_05085 [Helicobacter pylori]|nr:hypothetical protein DDP37_05085 [Helicobacter pylori]